MPNKETSYPVAYFHGPLFSKPSYKHELHKNIAHVKDIAEYRMHNSYTIVAMLIFQVVFIERKPLKINYEWLILLFSNIK